MAARYDNALWRRIFDRNESMYKDVTLENPDVALGIYGEEARAKRGAGSVIAASGGDVGGTFNKSPLLGMGADFAGKRMEARQRFQNQRIARLMGLTNMLSQSTASFENLKLGYANLDFQKEQANTFNWANLIPQLGANLSYTV